MVLSWSFLICSLLLLSLVVTFFSKPSVNLLVVFSFSFLRPSLLISKLKVESVGRIIHGGRLDQHECKEGPELTSSCPWLFLLSPTPCTSWVALTFLRSNEGSRDSRKKGRKMELSSPSLVTCCPKDSNHWIPNHWLYESKFNFYNVQG